MASHNLPPQSTHFVGRTVDLVEIARLLTDPACRLLTLVGPGGIGKTRLALQAAAEQLANYEDGVFFVGLASVGSPNLLASAIAAALAISLYGPEDPNVQIVNYLREKNLLLVLDNFEHLMDAVGLVVDLLARASRLKLLLASQARLHV